MKSEQRGVRNFARTILTILFGLIVSFVRK